VQNGQLAKTDVVVTGYGVLSPLGIGTEPYWRALTEGRSGISAIDTFDTSGLPVHVAGQIKDFDPKLYVRPRKSLKVMARDTQLGVAAADLAWQHAGLAAGGADPDRVGVIFGADVISSEIEESIKGYRACVVDGQFQFSRFGTYALAECFPLLFLKMLPNMIASHVAIAQDARGPNNTIHQGNVSSLLAINEAVRTIQRGAAEIIIAGGASSRMHPYDWIRACITDELACGEHEPTEVCRPFDAGRFGQVRGEGAAALILESRRHAQARGATILACVSGSASSIETPNCKPRSGGGLIRAVEHALREAHLTAAQIGHVNAHGASTQKADRIEASALRALFGDLPVTAPKSFFGNLCAASGAVEAIASLLALEHGQVPATLNYINPDPDCPVCIVREPLHRAQTAAVIVNQTEAGQAAAVVLSAP
jgi:3-oxoacyl-[acyl-carrier-protein] synthase II